MVGRNKKELRSEIAKMEISINEMQNLKASTNCMVKNHEVNHKLGLIERAISRLNNDLTILREKQSSETAFRSRAFD